MRHRRVYVKINVYVLMATTGSSPVWSLMKQTWQLQSEPLRSQLEWIWWFKVKRFYISAAAFKLLHFNNYMLKYSFIVQYVLPLHWTHKIKICFLLCSCLTESCSSYPLLCRCRYFKLSIILSPSRTCWLKNGSLQFILDLNLLNLIKCVDEDVIWSKVSKEGITVYL